MRGGFGFLRKKPDIRNLEKKVLNLQKQMFNLRDKGKTNEYDKILKGPFLKALVDLEEANPSHTYVEQWKPQLEEMLKERNQQKQQELQKTLEHYRNFKKNRVI